MLRKKNGHGYLFLSVQEITCNSVLKVIGFWKINFKLALDDSKNAKIEEMSMHFSKLA